MGDYMICAPHEMFHIWVIKSLRMWWTGHVTYWGGDKRIVLVGWPF